MIDVAYAALRFLHVESCGQCKTGIATMATALEDVVFGEKTIDELMRVLVRSVSTVTDGSRCYLPTQSQSLITSIFERFPFDGHERGTRRGDDPRISDRPRTHARLRRQSPHRS